MFLDVITGVISLANTFIALFIVVYAFLFLKKTKSHRERRPWDYLVVASMLYLLYTIMYMLLTLYKVKAVFGLGLADVSIFFQFIYTSLILLAFISQTDLIFKNEIIIITRKADKEKLEKEECGEEDSEKDNE